MMNRLEQFVENDLPTARLGSNGVPPGTPLGLTLSRVACFPVLTALQGGGGAVLHQGLRKSGGLSPLDDNPSAPPHNPSASQIAGKIFFNVGLTY